MALGKGSPISSMPRSTPAVQPDSPEEGKPEAVANKPYHVAGKQPDINDSELYTVNKETDTVQGQLDGYLDRDNAILKREAQKGRDMATARGLTNSTIASGNAIGKVLDKATEWATTDAGIYERRKTNNQQSAQSTFEANLASETSIKTNAASNAAQIASAGIQANATIQSTKIQANQSDKESIRASQDNQNRLDSAELIAGLDNASREKVEQANRDADYWSKNSQDKRQGAINAHSVYTQGIAAIDLTASKTSQQTQFDRLTKAYETQLDAVEAMKSDGSRPPAPPAPPLKGGQML